MITVIPMSVTISIMSQKTSIGDWQFSELWKFVLARQLNEILWFFLKPANAILAHQLPYAWPFLSAVGVGIDILLSVPSLALFFMSGAFLHAEFARGWRSVFWKEWRFTALFWTGANAVLYSFPLRFAFVLPILSAVIDLVFWTSLLQRRHSRP